MKFKTYGNCFVCGEKNSGGLRLCFEINPERKTLKTTFVASPTYQGWDGLVHGGIISTLLDEAMAKLVYELGYEAVTASLEVRFKKPAPIFKPLLVHGEIDGDCQSRLGIEGGFHAHVFAGPLLHFILAARGPEQAPHAIPEIRRDTGRGLARDSRIRGGGIRADETDGIAARG